MNFGFNYVIANVRTLRDKIFEKKCWSPRDAGDGFKGNVVGLVQLKKA
jgi:hypothetical protein